MQPLATSLVGGILPFGAVPNSQSKGSYDMQLPNIITTTHTIITIITSAVSIIIAISIEILQKI